MSKFFNDLMKSVQEMDEIVKGASFPDMDADSTMAMTPKDEIEQKCRTLWTALKDMDSLVVTTKQKEVLDTLLGFCAKDLNQVFKTLGIYL